MDTTNGGAAVTAAHAMHLVTLHVLDRGLPAAVSIDRPRGELFDDVVSVYIDSAAVDAWLDAMQVETEAIDEGCTIPGHERVVWRGHIDTAVGEVGLQVRSYRPVRKLAAVAGGDA